MRVDINNVRLMWEKGGDALCGLYEIRNAERVEWPINYQIIKEMNHANDK